jgi:hypothetical protein
MSAAEPHHGLRLLIHGAFADAPRPFGNGIAEHDCPECEQVRKTLGRYRADQVPDYVIDSLGSALPLLTPAGLRYYLPAYLVRVLRNPECPHVDLLIFHLSPNGNDLRYRRVYWSARRSVFMPAERVAVIHFVHWLAQTDVGRDYGHELQTALEWWSGHD